MNCITKIKNIALGLFLASMAFVGCKEEIDPAANAVQTEFPTATFAAVDAPEQIIHVYADGEWVADCEADWVTISPMSGDGATDVTVIVEDNLASDGTVNVPRETVVIFRGKYIERQGEITIIQKGDNYREAVEMSIAETAKLADGKFAKIPEAQVMAAASDGIVITDASGTMFVTYNGDVAVGDKVYVAGEKVTLDGIPSIKAGQVDVLSNAEPVYPSPVDLLANLDPSKAANVLYVEVTAGLLGRKLQFESSVPVTVTLLDPKTGTIDLNAVNMHNVKLEAYFVGLNGTNVNLVVTKVEDLGINDDLKAYFYDDFSWMKPFLDEYGKSAKPVGDAVGTDNPSAEAPNLKTSGGLAALKDEFYARGYEDLNPDAKVIYPQAYYWKFGKTDNHGGIKLPKMELEGAELINAELEFDWSPHMTGSGNIDKVSIVVELEGSGFFDNGTKISDPYPHELQKGDLNWHHVKLLVKGVNNTTRIMIRPLEFAAADPDQQRWHLDNVKVSDSDIPYKDPVYANVTVSEEIVTFEGTPAGPFEIKINSDNDWTLTKGMDSDWFSLDVTEGLAGEETTVKVTCEPSTSITMRKSSFTLASADTRKTIYVVQSAAGGELDPLISVAGGNLLELDGFATEFTLEVQANIEYEISTDVDWLEVVETPATRGIVEKFTHTFKKTANLTGAPRTGTITFYNEEEEFSYVVIVKQTNFEPVINAVVGYPIAAAGETRVVTIDANVPYTVTTDADWITLPAAQGPASVIEVPVTVAANTGGMRVATVVLSNAEFNFTKEVRIAQHPGGEATVVYEDDFSWMDSAIAAYVAAAGKKIGDTVGSNGSDSNAPNAYTDKNWLATDFWDNFNARGYENTNPSGKVLYPQDAYLKFGKTGVHSGLYLPSIAPEGDVILTFNWCAQVQGSGIVDPVKMIVEIEGDGVCCDNNQKISTPAGSTQPTGTYEWQTYSVHLSGVTASTRILIRHTDMTSGKAIRFHLDNIKIVK